MPSHYRDIIPTAILTFQRVISTASIRLKEQAKPFTASETTRVKLNPSWELF